MQLLSSSALDFVERWFTSDVLKATLASSGIIGTHLGIRSPGTAYVLLHHYMGEIDGEFRSWGLPRGGTGAVSNAIAAAAREAGAVDPHVARRWRRSTSENGARGDASCSRAATRLTASTIVSGADLRVTFDRLVGLEHVPAELADIGAPLPVPRRDGQGEPRARRPARLPLSPGRRTAPRRRDLDLAERRRISSAPTTSREVRRLLARGRTSTS